MDRGEMKNSVAPLLARGDDGEDNNGVCTANDSISSQDINEHADYDGLRRRTNPHYSSEQQHPFTVAKRQRGMIYFREVTPSDRSIIQTLHERWFPVDYKDDFFDVLCNREKMRVLPGLGNNGEPLYCCVACFRELSDEEFEDWRRRRWEREERLASWSSIWSDGNEFGSDNCVDENNECLLWEFDAPTDDDNRRNDSTTCISAGSKTSQSQQELTNNGVSITDDAIESGNSVFSIYHRTERERMRRFYANGFRFDEDVGYGNRYSRSYDNGGASRGNIKHPNVNANENRNNSITKRSTAIEEEGPYHNDAGERIVGCVVGSFLSSSIASPCCNTSGNALDEKNPIEPERDETAKLLVPDYETYPKMFYIMTLGTAREFRRCGLGSALVERVVDMIENCEPGCGALYLHVITYNEGAIRLYERLGFSRVKQIKDYYIINSVNYDCYLYTRYFHGNRGHKTTFDILYELATAIIRKLGYALIQA